MEVYSSEVTSLEGMATFICDFLRGVHDESPNHDAPILAETRPLVPDLLALNRAGMLTLESQPGHTRAHTRGREYVTGITQRHTAERVRAYLAEHKAADGARDIAFFTRRVSLSDGETGGLGEGAEPLTLTQQHVHTHHASARADTDAWEATTQLTVVHDTSQLATTDVGVLCFLESMATPLPDSVLATLEEYAAVDMAWGRRGLLMRVLRAAIGAEADKVAHATNDAADSATAVAEPDPLTPHIAAEVAEMLAHEQPAAVSGEPPGAAEGDLSDVD